MDNADQDMKTELADVSDVAVEERPAVQSEVKPKPKWPWVVVVVVLVVLLSIVIVLVLKPWRNEDETVQMEGDTDGIVNEEVSNGYRGDVLSVEEGMRELCRDLRIQSAKAPRIVEGWLPRYWYEESGIYTSAQSDREYFVVCDWKIGIAMEDGLLIAKRFDADEIWFTAITVDTDYYRKNKFDGKWEAPVFFSDMINDSEKDDIEVSLGVVVRVPEQKRQEIIDECDGDEYCLVRLDLYYTPFMEHDGYMFIDRWGQASNMSCPSIDDFTVCQELWDWEDESRSRLAKWLRSDNWVKF